MHIHDLRRFPFVEGTDRKTQQPARADKGIAIRVNPPSRTETCTIRNKDMAKLIHTDDGWRYEQEKIYLLRAKWHDYQEPSIYMLTMVTPDRKPLFGALRGSGAEAYIGLTALGEAVAQEIERMPAYKGFESAEIYTYTVMPDHIHVLLRVKERLVHPLGYYVQWFKRQCSEGAAEIFARGDNPASETEATGATNPAGEEGSALAAISASNNHNEKRPFPLVFAPEYHDRILTHRGQLEQLKHYIQDNPRRLAIRRENPELFRLRQDVGKNGLTFTALGNMFLLDYPLKEVAQCSRSLTQEQIDRKKQDCLLKADCGVVFVSAGISEGEKQICRALREAGYPLVMLLKDGFPQPTDEHYKYYKPNGAYFEACSDGRLLLLEPKPEDFETEEIARTIEQRFHDLPHDTARYKFLALNEVAKRL